MDKVRNSVNSENSENLINCSSMNWGQFKRSSLLPVSYWSCGSILVPYTGGGRFK